MYRSMELKYPGIEPASDTATLWGLDLSITRPCFSLCVASRSHPLREARVQRKEKSFFHGSERLGIESRVGSNWPRLDLRSSMHAKPCCHGGVVCGRARPGPRAPSPPPLIR